MGHPIIENRTRFAFEPAFLSDEENCAVFVPIIKATFRINTNGVQELAEEQIPVNFVGEYFDHGGNSSYKYEPECTYMKPATDCVLIGHAHAVRANTVEAAVIFRIGTVQKTVCVFGNRAWIKSLGSVTMTRPVPFDKIPLTYERAFGGWDRHHPNLERHTFEPRNPVGVGFRECWNADEASVQLPNLESPEHLIRDIADRPPPAAFGFLAAHWVPRCKYAGTYDKAWAANRFPLLPIDFDRRFFNAASPGLIAPDYLRGDEPVTVVGASTRGRLDFNLPGVPPPRVQVELRGHRMETLVTKLDTVVINTDEDIVILIWRAYLNIRNVPHDVVSVTVECDNFSRIRSV
jgi:hypothetical protein